MTTRPVTTWDVLDGHVTLDLQCLDRRYLNGYVPNLQVAGQIVQFLAAHGFPIPSSAVVGRIGDRFREAVRPPSHTEHIPVVRFAKHARKLDVTRPHLDRQAATGRSGGRCDRGGPGAPVGRVLQHPTVERYGWPRTSRGGRAERRVSYYYFNLWDEEFGPAFVKVCSYMPHLIKIWLNGHEWTKQQATTAGIGFTALVQWFRVHG